MKIPAISTKGKKLTLSFDVDYRQPITLQIVGYDVDRPKTLYFDRTHWEDQPGICKLEFPLAVSPKRLAINFYNVTNGDERAYDVVGAMSSNLKQKRDARIHPQTLQFFEFAKWFCKNAAYLPPGVYRDRKRKFKIIYYGGGIVDKKEGEIDTAARADHETNDIEFSKEWFKDFTVPAAIVISLHEYIHLAWNTWDETEADLRAVDVALCYGLPKTECLYAFTRIFSNSNTSAERANIIAKYIDEWEM